MSAPGRKPNLFIVGAPKSGTTALWTYLRGRPEIFTGGKEHLESDLPAAGGKVITASTPHANTISWLTAKLGGKPGMFAELPDKLELAARVSGLGVDPDQALVDRLVNDGALKKSNAPDVKELRQLISDPIPKWLLLQKIVTEEQLHNAFLGVAGLPPAENWQTDEVRRLATILPPGFANENGVYALQETKGAIRLGLSQMPTTGALLDLYDRLGGYSLCFQALNQADVAKLRDLVSQV